MLRQKPLIPHLWLDIPILTNFKITIMTESQQKEFEAYKSFYESFKNRPMDIHCGAKIDYLKARAFDVEEKLSKLKENDQKSE